MHHFLFLLPPRKVSRAMNITNPQPLYGKPQQNRQTPNSKQRKKNQTPPSPCCDIESCALFYLKPICHTDHPPLLLTCTLGVFFLFVFLVLFSNRRPDTKPATYIVQSNNYNRTRRTATLYGWWVLTFKSLLLLYSRPHTSMSTVIPLSRFLLGASPRLFWCLGGLCLECVRVI